jgi:uncharacterized alkaline shock family protein YloU
MLTKENHIGTIEFTEEYLIALTANTVSSCFGVAGISNLGAIKRIKNFMILGTSGKKGIYISTRNNKLSVDIHIEVIFGMNINAVTESIINKVSFTMEQSTGTPVESVRVYVDKINA